MEVPNLDKFLDLILHCLALLGRVHVFLMVSTLLPSVDIVWSGHFPWRRDQLSVESLVQNPSPLGRQGCVPREPDWSVLIVSASVIPLTQPTLTVFLLFVLLSTGLGAGLVMELSKFFQLHVFRNSLQLVSLDPMVGANCSC